MSLEEQLIKAVKKYCINTEEYKKNTKDVQSLLARGASANAVDRSWTHKPTVLYPFRGVAKKEIIDKIY